jgi:chromosome segregation ATPase
MSITKKYLEDLGLTAEQVSSIFAERGKEIETEKAKYETLQAQITEKDNSINELNEKIKSFDGKETTLAELQKKVADYEQKETERIESEKQMKADSEMKERFTKLLGENKFKHQDIENGRFSAFKQALADEANKGKGDSDIFTEITKDMDCFVNPQQETIVLPGGGGGNRNTDSLARAREIMGLPKDK